MDFITARELLLYCNENDKKISYAMLQREINCLETDGDSVLSELKSSWQIMVEACKKSISEPQKSMGGLIGGEAKKLSDFTGNKFSLCGKLVSDAVAYGMSVLEVNSSMGLIVAAPTAGSCGVVPGCMLSMKEHFNFSDDAIYDGLLNSAAIGYLFMRNASVSGAEAGCQAEVGVASAMSASAIVEIMGGTPEQSQNAAALTISNLLGLVCDPVGGFVEVPCQTRNAVGISNAFLSAELSLAGINHPICLDAMIDTMYSVGCKIPPELRETSQGGNATAYRRSL